MPRRLPLSVGALADLSRTQQILQLRARRAAARAATQASNVALVRESVRELTSVAAREMYKNAVAEGYVITARSIFGSFLEQLQHNLPAEMKDKYLKAYDAVVKGTIENDPEIRTVFEKFADSINSKIFENYVESFGNRESYRVGQNRLSGNLEGFLRSAKLARVIDTVDGVGVEINLESVDPSVIHIFRLNYGTEATGGSAKRGVAAPTFSLTLGERSSTSRLKQPRRPGFTIPASFGPYAITVGGAGQAQLFRAKDATGGSRGTVVARGKGGRTTRGIAPSYFIERGVVEAIPGFQADLKLLFDKWARRKFQVQA